MDSKGQPLHKVERAGLDAHSALRDSAAARSMAELACRVQGALEDGKE